VATEVKRCTCKNDFQDREYGKDHRLMNTNLKGGVSCTVCGAIHRGDFGDKGKK
jgi:hypothetical protein